MRSLAIFLTLALLGCAPVPAPEAVPVRRPVPTAVSVSPLCERVKVYSDAESKALADAVIKLDASSIIITALADYARMRAEADACHKATN